MRAPSVIRARYLMGTIFRFEAPGEDAREVGESLEAALDEVEHLESLLSNWRKDSELSLLNARAGRGAIPVGRELFDVLQASLRWARITDGAFDPALEPFTRAFRGGAPPGAHAAPGREWKRMRLEVRESSVLLPRGTGIDLGGIGKGFALDRAAAVLEKRGIRAALLDAGGQILALGSPPGEPGWRIAVADPRDRGHPALELVLRDVSAATSGNSERPGEILDPETGVPVAGRFSATALAAEATAADALSTALFVMGPARGEAWARGRSDVLVVYLEPGSRRQEALHLSGSLARPPHGEFWLVTARGSGHHRSVHAEMHPARKHRHSGAGDFGRRTSGERGRCAGLAGSARP
ncbi:MAG TPA: FAD:protein FMN transferase [Candidatus Polarisedimenticolia bacterium]|nr:FAD:protein FMN transferase [Candidatus Polarisedimenticolia bacterium]